MPVKKKAVKLPVSFQDRMKHNVRLVTEAMNQGEYENEMEQLLVLMACQSEIVQATIEHLEEMQDGNPSAEQEEEPAVPEQQEESGGSEVPVGKKEK